MGSRARASIEAQSASAMGVPTTGLPTTPRSSLPVLPPTRRRASVRACGRACGRAYGGDRPRRAPATHQATRGSGSTGDLPVAPTTPEPLPLPQSQSRPTSACSSRIIRNRPLRLPPSCSAPSLDPTTSHSARRSAAPSLRSKHINSLSQKHSNAEQSI